MGAAAVLETLATQPSGDVGGHRLDGFGVLFHPESVMTRHPCALQGGTTPGQRIENGQSLALVATSRAAAAEACDREVEQQPGELLIGLAPVLGDGDKILIDDVDSRQFQGSQQVAMTFEAGESCRGPR